MNKASVIFLDEKWQTIKDGVKVDFIPRMNELVYLEEYNKYFRVANTIYSFKGKKQFVYVIIEEYTDDFALMDDKKIKKP
jgi:hypothetical protein